MIADNLTNDDAKLRNIALGQPGAGNRRRDASNVLSQSEAEDAIDRFCEMIRFPTVSSLAVASGAYKACGDWLLQTLRDVERNTRTENNDDTTSTGVSVPRSVFDEVFILPESPVASPVIVASITGVDPTLPILLLNSHYDVVPANTIDEGGGWTMDPFGGLRSTDDGKIYGRGTQDMKCVCVQYIEAIRKIYKDHPHWKPERSIYLTFVPDEG
jgi:aminoacylase